MEQTETSKDPREIGTFCTKAFNGLTINQSGACAPCCLFETVLTKEDGSPYTVREDDLLEIYNSKSMQEIRKKMLNGEQIKACDQCYQLEVNDGVSLRMQANRQEFDESINYSAHEEHVPAYLDLKFHNKCNLKCRMCRPRDSQLIADEFQKIIDKEPIFSMFPNTNLLDNDLHVPFEDISDWSSSDKFRKEFKKILPSVKHMCVAGGEPLYLNQFYDVMDLCATENAAKNISLFITTNLNHVPFEKLQRYVPFFKLVLFNISLDAVGKQLTYIRYPAKFEDIENNFKKLYSLLKNSGFQFSPTVQIYNILYLPDIYRFVEGLLRGGHKLTENPVHLTFLKFPIHLNIRILPQNVRDEARLRLSAVEKEIPLLLQHDVFRANHYQILKTLDEKERPKRDFVPSFLYYSRALDKERGQDGKEFLPELFSLLSDVKPAPPAVQNLTLVKIRSLKLSKAGMSWAAIRAFNDAIKLIGGNVSAYERIRMIVRLFLRGKKYRAGKWLSSLMKNFS